MISLFFFNDTATTEIYTLSLHDALPIFDGAAGARRGGGGDRGLRPRDAPLRPKGRGPRRRGGHLRHGRRREGDHKHLHRSEEHTSELQSRQYLVCRLLLEKKKTNNINYT